MYALDYSNAVEALAKRPLLLLTRSRYLIRHFLDAAFRGEVTSPAGLQLPAEIWLDIAHRVLALPACDWVPVQPERIESKTPEKIVVRCTEVSNNISPPEGTADIRRYEEFMANPDSAEAYWTVEAPSMRQARRFVVEIPSNPSSTYEPCLFGGLDYADWIARIEGGDCSICLGSRQVCPTCTELVDDGNYTFLGCAFFSGRFEDFYDRVDDGCDFDLACPRCMGLGFCSEDEGYLEDYYGRRAPKQARDARIASINARRRELGYHAKRGDEYDHDLQDWNGHQYSDGDAEAED